MFFKCARDRSQWSRRPGMIHRLLRAVDKVPCAKHCRWRWPAVSCAAAARSRRAQLALCRRHALDRTGKQSWHAAAEPYTPHGNGLDETSTAAMEAVLRHRKPEKISPPEAPWYVSGGGVGPRAFLRIPGRKNNESEIISKSTSTRGLLERLYDMGQILRGHHHGLTMVSTWITISTRLTFTCWIDHARRKIE